MLPHFKEEFEAVEGKTRWKDVRVGGVSPERVNALLACSLTHAGGVVLKDVRKSHSTARGIIWL